MLNTDYSTGHQWSMPKHSNHRCFSGSPLAIFISSQSISKYPRALQSLKFLITVSVHYSFYYKQITICAIVIQKKKKFLASSTLSQLAGGKRHWKGIELLHQWIASSSHLYAREVEDAQTAFKPNNNDPQLTLVYEGGGRCTNNVGIKQQPPPVRTCT